MYSQVTTIGGGRFSYSSTPTTASAGALTLIRVSITRNKVIAFLISHTSIFIFQVSGSAAAKRQLDKKQKRADKQHDRESQHGQQYNAYSTHANPPILVLCDSSIRFAKSVGVFAD